MLTQSIFDYQKRQGWQPSFGSRVRLRLKLIAVEQVTGEETQHYSLAPELCNVIST